jgi:glucose-6-phosphate 1-epimerase
MASTDAIDDLNARFAISGIAQVVAGNGGQPKIQIATPAACAEIYLHGAQIASWKPAGHEEILFLSTQSRFEEGKAIRGGIPICFPWFRAKAGDPNAPSHGFVRTKAWQLESIAAEQDCVVVILATESDEQSLKLWPHEFRLTLRATVGPQLKLELNVFNTGSTAFQFEEALHTYFRVGSAEEVRIHGLDGVSYLDNRDQNREKTQQGDKIFRGATDNAYTETQSPVEILDPILKRRIRTEKQNSTITIVWNPWQEGAAALADLGDGEWRQFACVEAGNILGAAISLAPGAQHTITATITIADE